MNEKQLAFASLFLAILGLAIILFFTKGMKAKEVAISDLESNLGSYVQISGFVSSFRVSKENVMLTLCSGECASVVIFKSVASGMANPNPYLTTKGDWLTVRGQVQEYNGEPEVVVLRPGDLERG
ncbi:MAG: hypothetical protein ABIF01_00180 [Candidatus Micrarchaeota archaeon]